MSSTLVVHVWSKQLSVIMKQFKKTNLYIIYKEREKSRECHNHKAQPFSDTKRITNQRKSNKRTKSTTISSLFPKRGNSNAIRVFLLFMSTPAEGRSGAYSVSTVMLRPYVCMSHS